MAQSGCLPSRRGDAEHSNDDFPLAITGPRATARGPVIASSVRLTPVAVVVTRATMAVVVTPAATAIVVAKATVVTVESVRVAAPPRVPEVARAPLRERPGLGLGYASRFHPDEP